MKKFKLTFTSKKGLIVDSSVDKECEDLNEFANELIGYLQNMEKDKEKEDIDGITITFSKKYTTEDGKELYIELCNKNIHKNEYLWLDFNDELSGLINHYNQQKWAENNQDKIKLMQGNAMGMPPGIKPEKKTESGIIL